MAGSFFFKPSRFSIIAPALRMEAQEHHITISKTARYYTLGTLSKKTKTIWFVCHGFAQLANEFIKEFQPLLDEETLIVAPEALSRFYVKGFFGQVGATWMTKEDRLNEINDYVNYLDDLRKKIIEETIGNAKVQILGFSQGTSTVSRWVTYKNPEFDCLWLCAGNIPDDIDSDRFRSMAQQHQVQMIIGYDDPFIQEKDRQAAQKRILDNDWNVTIHSFSGAHVLNFDLIKSLSAG